MIRAKALSLTAIMERDGIRKIERTAGRFHVVMMDGHSGVGSNVGEALAKAMQSDALNVDKAA